MQDNQFTSFRNSTIFYRLAGSGETVVFIHGFGEDGSIWNEITDRLKHNFRLIIPDIPGSGKSQALIDKQRQVTIDDYAEAIIKILEKESVTACTIIGHSMGGYIALSVLEKCPEKLNGFGLFHSTAFADDEEKKKARLKSIQFMKFNDALSFLRTSIPTMFTDKFKQEQNDKVEALIECGKYFNNETLIQYYEAMISRPQRINVLENTTLPVLFIIGEKDEAIPLKQSLAQCHLPSTAYINILPAAAHMGMLEAPEASVNMIKFFLNSVNN